MNKTYFHYAFQINKMVVFFVNYYKLGNNQNPYFSTSASEFVRNKKTYNTCGQCQKDVLPTNSLAYQFFQKWDKFHLLDLNNDQYNELCQDIELLKEKYNYIQSSYDDINFYKVVELSKMQLKPNKKKSKNN